MHSWYCSNHECQSIQSDIKKKDTSLVVKSVHVNVD